MHVSDEAQPTGGLSSSVTLKVVALLSGVLTIVFVISFFFSQEGISELQQARQRVAAIQQDIERLRAENLKLAEQINNLRNSTFSVEKIAREDLGMAKQGEIVYVVEDDDKIER